MATTTNKSGNEDLLTRLTKPVEVLALILGVGLALIKFAQEIQKEFFPSRRYDAWVILLSAIISIAVAIAIGYYRKGLLEFVGRLLPGLKRIVVAAISRVRLSHKAAICVYILFICSVLYFVALRTDAWRLIRSLYTERFVDLVSPSRQNTFQPAMNFPWRHYGQDIGLVARWGWRGVSRNPGAFEDSFERLRQSGIRHVVWFLFCDGRASLQFDSRGHVSGLAPEFLEDYDAAIDIAWKTGMGITWVIIDYQFMFPKREDQGANLSGHADLIEDSEKQHSFRENALKPIFRRSRYSPEIAGWVLINEPENALKDGFISPGAIQSFALETASLIRENTQRQPISMAHLDLESLLEYSKTYVEALDFLVFHHYASHLPPPVSEIRRLMPEAGQKPIYIGEFDIHNPPVPIELFVKWSRQLGYAGLWPWNPNAGREVRGNPVPTAYEEAALISRTITGVNRHGDRLFEEFESRRRPDAASFNSDVQQEMNWWAEYWSTTAIPNINGSILEWAKQDALEKSKYAENQVFEQQKLGWIKELNSRNGKKQQELNEAQDSLAKNMKASNQAGIAASQKWVDNVNAELKRIENDIQNERNQLGEARQKMSLHRSLVDYYAYKSKWSRELYRKMWESEKRLWEEGKQRGRW